MEFNYKILNPGGNKTAIVIGNEYSAEERKEINNKILKDNSDVEQVGFISTDKNRLDMAGGEFCVNATRCAIWEYLKGKEGEIELEVSGLKSKAKGGITDGKEVFADMKVEKTLNTLIEKKGIYNLVKLDGITLAVVEEKNAKEYIKLLKEDEDTAKEKLKEIMKTFDTEESAVGIILLEEGNGKTKINPVIWVRTVDTLYYETACGSGSLATTIYKYSMSGLEKLEVVQPSGYSINVTLNIEEDYIEKAVILGKVMENE